MEAAHEGLSFRFGAFLEGDLDAVTGNDDAAEPPILERDETDRAAVTVLRPPDGVAVHLVHGDRRRQQPEELLA